MMPDIIIKDANGNAVIYRNVNSVEFLEAPPEENTGTGDPGTGE